MVGGVFVAGALLVGALVVGGVVVAGALLVGALVVGGVAVLDALGAVVVVGGADVELLGVSEVDVVEGTDDVVTEGATELVGPIVLTTLGTVSTLVEGAGAAVLFVVLGGIRDVVVDVPTLVVVELDDVVVAGAGSVAVAAYTSSSRMIAGP